RRGRDRRSTVERAGRACHGAADGRARREELGHDRRAAEGADAGQPVAQRDASPGELAATGQLVMLTQRIGKSANEFLTTEGVSPEAVFLLGKDLNTFKEIAQGLQDGSPELRLAGSKDPQTRERLEALMKLYE